MSAQEIVAQLPGLSRAELEKVRDKLLEMLEASPRASTKGWGEALLEVAGEARGLPADLAANHDYYLHGLPRR